MGLLSDENTLERKNMIREKKYKKRK